MPLEIERKFLVNKKLLFDSGILFCPPESTDSPYISYKYIRQGYLLIEPDKEIRIRAVRKLNNVFGFITIKLNDNNDLIRQEFEYPIPFDAAKELIANNCHLKIYKRRYIIGRFEVDCFEGENSGLIIAELELKSPDEEVSLPEWIGEEITFDKRYKNKNLAINPYGYWKDDNVTLL